MHGFISGLYFIPLIYISVFVPVPYCLDNCGFVVEPEVRPTRPWGSDETAPEFRPGSPTASTTGSPSWNLPGGPLSSSTAAVLPSRVQNRECPTCTARGLLHPLPRQHLAPEAFPILPHRFKVASSAVHFSHPSA